MDASSRKSTLPFLWDYAVAAYLVLIGFFGSGINATVLYVMYRRRKVVKPPEIFLGIIAVFDLFASAILIPMPATAAVMHGWIFGSLGCEIYGFICYLTGLINISVLTVMSVVRCLVVWSDKLGIKITWPKSTTLSVASILYGLTWAVCPLLGWGSYGLEPSHITCSLNWSGDISYLINAFVCGFAVPLLMMVCSYSGICYRINQRPVLGDRFQPRMLKMTILMCSGFIVAWLPYAVVSFLFAFKPDIIHVTPGIAIIPPLLAKSSWVYNPVIYFLGSKRFRKAAKEEIMKVKCNTRCHLCASNSVTPVSVENKAT